MTRPRSRRRGRAALAFLVVGGALVLAPGGEGGATPVADDGTWPMSRRDPQHRAATVITALASGAPRPWSFDGSGRVWGYQPGLTVWSSPALARVGDRAVVAVGSYDRNLYCLDAATGELQWRLTTGGAVLGAPAIVRDDEGVWLYATSGDRLVYAVDASLGRQRWAHAVEDYRPTIGGARLSAPAVGTVGGRAAVFVGAWVWDASLARNLQRATMVALDARNGKPLWRQRLGDNQLTAPVVTRIGGRGWLLVGSHDGTVSALDADSGKLMWRHAELDAVRSPPAVAEASVGALVVLASKYGAVRALRLADGREQWKHKTGDRITGAPVVVAHRGRSLVVVGSYDRRLYALDVESGGVIWRYDARGGFYSSAAVASLESSPLMVASAWDHMLHAVALDDGQRVFQRFTGRPLWNVAGLDASNWSSPAVAQVNGRWMAYVGSYDGTLRAIPLDEEGRAAGVGRRNLLFWLSFPLALGPVAGLALLLTRLHRARERRRRQKSQPIAQAPISNKGTAA